MKPKHIIIYTFQSLEDPLIKGLILEYLKTHKGSGQELVFHLLTHEQKEFTLDPEQIAVKKTDLLNFNIQWYPIKYRSGAFIILKKAFNFVQTFFIALKIKWKYNPVAIMGFLAIAGGYSYILSKLLSLKLIVYCFEPHSEYMIDFDIWKKSSLKYKLLKKFELLQIRNSEFIVVPNNYTKLLVERFRNSANLYVCPISINTDSMVFDRAARERIRKSLKAEQKTIIIYTGKFGGIYYSGDEVSGFFAKLYSENKSLFFYVITPNVTEIKTSIAKYGLPSESVHISLTVSYPELNQHISAADIGFVALPSLPSQKYRTPVKTAIYMSCGVPYIVNKGIGEDDLIATTKNVGVVINNLDESASLIANKINSLLSGDPKKLHQRCREEAVNTRSISSANAVLNKIFNRL